MKTGIYKILCLSSGHFYIGQSKDLNKKIRAARALQVFSEGCFNDYNRRRKGQPRDSQIGEKISKSLSGKKLSHAYIQSLRNSHPGRRVEGVDSLGNEIYFNSLREAAEHFSCTKAAIFISIRNGTFTTRPTAKPCGWKFAYCDAE